jgi:hypothetical protein
MGADSMASQILKAGEQQIIKTLQEARAILADLVSFDREQWKAELRHTVLAAIPLAEGAKREDVVRQVRRGFAQKMSSRPWYPALAEEVVDEELSADGAERRKRVLAALAMPVAAPVKKEVVAPTNGREVLLDTVRLFARPHEDFATALAVLEENEKLLAATHSQGGFLRRLFGGSNADTDRSYKVQFAEPGAGTMKTEMIDFPAFLAESGKKASLLATLSAGSGPAFRKLEGTADEALTSFVDRQLVELHLVHRRLGSLNTLFQARAASDKKTVRGIKVELLTIKNSLVKASQRRREYAGDAKG